MEIGVAPETAKNGRETIGLIEKARDADGPFDIVLLDWMMPDISGLDVLTYFRTKPEHAGTAFIMVTAECEGKSILKAIHAGAAAYIMKPMSRDELKNKFLEVYKRIKSNRVRIESPPM